MDKFADWGEYIPPQIEDNPQLSAIYEKLNEISRLLWRIIIYGVIIAFCVAYYHQ